MKKTNKMVSIDSEIVQDLQKIGGINVSAICNEALKLSILDMKRRKEKEDNPGIEQHGTEETAHASWLNQKIEYEKQTKQLVDLRKKVLHQELNVDEFKKPFKSYCEAFDLLPSEAIKLIEARLKDRTLDAKRRIIIG